MKWEGEKRMKRVILMVMLISGLVAGCAEVESAQSEPVEVSRFMEVENSWNWRVVVDRETGVMYAVSNGSYNMGTFTLLVDADGKPLIWEDKDE